MDGIFNIYKEKGFTSHDVVAIVRRTIHMKKVGHTGTLDPDAEGVLPVCVGKATKLSDVIMDGRKSYRAMLRLGITTTTEDASGEVLETKAVVFDEEKIRAAVTAFIGRLEQVPPMYSAVKVNGKKLYELAREGKEIARKARTIEVYDIRIRRFLPPDRVEMDIDCSKGTYIRTLCADIGKALGCGGHMAELLRTATGSFSLENAIKLDDLKALAEQERAEEALLTMQEALRDFPVIKIAEGSTKLLYNGAYILSTFEPQGRRIMTKNPNYWDKDNVFIDAIEETYNKEMDTIAPEMFKRNETDLAYLSADILDAWLAADDTKNMVSPSRVDSSYSYFYAFNFEPKFDEAYEPDNWTLAVNNENFRQSIFHALDRVKAKTVMQPYDPESFIINTVTPPNFTDLNGVDFSEVGDLAAISARDSFQSDKALEYKEKAVEELTAEGATFPVKVLMPYNPSSTNWDKECQVVEQQLEGLLGSDYIDVIVEAGPSTGFLSEVRRGGKFALMKCNWGADYADPATWTEPFSDTGSDSYLHWRADTAAGVRDIIAEYDALVAEAKAQVEDMSVRYNTFAQAEASIINHAVIIPYGVEGDGFKATRLNELEAEYAPYGLARQRYKYQKLRTEPMSQNEFNTLYEAWQAERAKALAAE